MKYIDAIDKLADEPHAGGALKGNFKGLRCVCAGNYRVIYEVLDNKLIFLVGYWREVYR